MFNQALLFAGTQLNGCLMHMVLQRHEYVPLFCTKTKTINKHLFVTFINYIRNL